jgi:deoxyribose-phosphate aldolase
MENLNKYIDHTALKATTTEEEIKKLCSEAKEYNFKSVCVNPAYVALASSELSGSDVLVCTVIGFPLGANTLEIKTLETLDAVKNGADEIDMVINVAKAKEHDYKYIEEEIRMVVGAAGGHTVKVILETCYLSEDEKVACTLAAARAKANFVKTSTGFGTGGALVTDVVTMKANITPDMEVKASGGIKTLEDALTMIKVGATRIGTSSGIAIIEAYNAQEGE